MLPSTATGQGQCGALPYLDMSNQSGIGISQALANEFPEFVQSNDIAAVLNIDHEKEHVALTSRVRGALADVQKHLEQRNDGQLEASYVALRLPDGIAFVQFMPDEAPLSSKMKYASSMATVHKQLGGSGTFTTNIFWTTLDEMSDRGVAEHTDHENAPKPMTEEEASLASAVQSHGTRGSSVAGQSTLAIHANVTDSAAKQLRDLEEGSAIVLQIDDAENIDLVESLPVASLAEHLAGATEPRYVVGKLRGTDFFAVCSPGRTSIKQRMLVASTRISFLEYLKTFMKSSITQIETFDPATDLAVKNLESELGEEESPASAADSNTTAGSATSKPRFSRPRPPKRR